MGWLSMPLSSMSPHSTPKAYLDAQFTYDRRDADGKGRALRVIASSCLRNKIWYAAVTPSSDGVDGATFAVVCLVAWNPRAKDGFVFAYKDMDETMGPNEAECPERILALLGETDHASALDWRRRCLDRLAQRSTRPLEHGMHIRLPRTMKFTDGHEGTDFIVHKRGRKIALAKLGSDYAGYRISGLRDMAWIVVPPPAQTRVHKTVFG